nr:hypothetical protein Itr_chr13CG05600 [Ipomoea trifida]
MYAGFFYLLILRSLKRKPYTGKWTSRRINHSKLQARRRPSGAYAADSSVEQRECTGARRETGPRERRRVHKRRSRGTRRGNTRRRDGYHGSDRPVHVRPARLLLLLQEIRRRSTNIPHGGARRRHTTR